MRPLYKHESLNANWPNKNTGLWFDKYCDQWNSDFSDLGDHGKKDWIKEVVGRQGNAETLHEATTRLSSLLASRKQKAWVFRSTSDFVTGLGRNHPVENGFAWHHILAVPYLPGSSVKGMVRAFAEQFAEEFSDIKDMDKKILIERIFGPRPKDNEDDAKAGSIIFLDAIPTEPAVLKSDVMTPHYVPYYENKEGKAVPADWHSPVPIPFLVVAKGLKLQFGMMPRKVTEYSKADLTLVKSWLELALKWTGAGAKTAVGYGRFEPHEESLHEHLREVYKLSLGAEAARLNNTQLDFLLDSENGDWANNRDNFYAKGDAWVAKAQSSDKKTEDWLMKRMTDLLDRHKAVK